MITIIVAALFIVILAADLLPKWKYMVTKEKVVYCLLLLAGFGVQVLFTLDVPFPSPSTAISKLLDYLFPALKQ